MIRFPLIRGVADRLLLIHYRADLSVLADLLPEGFRPREIDGHGIAGICLARCHRARPPFLPRALGWNWDHAVHWLSATWPHEDTTQTGIYVLRGDSSLKWTALLNGQQDVPGGCHRANFIVREDAEHISIRVQGTDQALRVSVEGYVVAGFPPGSMFRSLDVSGAWYQHAEFRRRGNVYYAENSQRAFPRYHAEAVALPSIESSLFGDKQRFPPNSLQLDSCVLLRRVVAAAENRLAFNWTQGGPERETVLPAPVNPGSCSRQEVVP